MNTFPGSQFSAPSVLPPKPTDSGPQPLSPSEMAQVSGGASGGDGMNPLFAE